MPTTCTPSSLADSAKCFECITKRQRDAINTYLLAVIAGGSTSPSVLMPLAKSFADPSLTKKQLLAIQAYLMCQILNK